MKVFEKCVSTKALHSKQWNAFEAIVVSTN